MSTHANSIKSPGPKKQRTFFLQKLAAAAVVAVMTTGAATSTARAEGRAGGWDTSTKRLKVIGLTDDGRLVRFKVKSPRKARTIGYVSGLEGPDTALVGIDFRVQDGKLYGVANGGGVYRFDGIDSNDAAATLVNRLIDGNGQPVLLEGTHFGVDFNPAADRLRIVSDAGQNLRHNVNTGGTTAVDDPLDYPPATPPNTSGPTALSVSAAAYTNNDLDAKTGTTLFGVDTSRDQVVIQSPPNNGSLAASGSLAVDADVWAGFDIYSRLAGGVAVSNTGFATLAVSGTRGLYHISLLTGTAFLIGQFVEPVVDIAIPLDQ